MDSMYETRRVRSCEVQMLIGSGSRRGQLDDDDDDEEEGSASLPDHTSESPYARMVPDDNRRQNGKCPEDKQGTSSSMFMTYRGEVVAEAPNGSHERRRQEVQEENESEDEEAEPSVKMLVKAVRLNQRDRVEQLLDMGVGINDIYFKRTPLFYAVDINKPFSLDMVKFLCNKGATVYGKKHNSEKQSCPFHQAAYLNRRDIIDYFLETLSVDFTDEEGLTPVMAACKKNHMDLIRYLVEVNGANILHRMVDRTTSLHIGAVRGYMDVVQYCIEKGEDVNAVQNDGTTALMLAACRGSSTVANYLIQHGADVTLKDRDGWSALHSAACYNYPAVVEALVKAGADVNEKSNEGYTPVLVAAEADRAKTILQLFNYGANINLPNRHGNSALIEATTRYHLFATWALLDCGAEINTKSNFDKFTGFLMGQSMHEKIDLRDVMRLMLEAGAKFEATSLRTMGKSYMVNRCVSMNRLYKHVAMPHPLQMICRLKIRRALRKPISQNIGKLNIPDKLKDEIAFIRYLKNGFTMISQFGDGNAVGETKDSERQRGEKTVDEILVSSENAATETGSYPNTADTTNTNGTFVHNADENTVEATENPDRRLEEKPVDNITGASKRMSSQKEDCLVSSDVTDIDNPNGFVAQNTDENAVGISMRQAERKTVDDISDATESTASQTADRSSPTAVSENDGRAAGIANTNIDALESASLQENEGTSVDF